MCMLQAHSFPWLHSLSLHLPWLHLLWRHLLWLHLPSQMQAQQLAQLQSNVTARAHALNMAQVG